jgi:hypothetical protein
MVAQFRVRALDERSAPEDTGEDARAVRVFAVESGRTNDADDPRDALARMR